MSATVAVPTGKLDFRTLFAVKSMSPEDEAAFVAYFEQFLPLVEVDGKPHVVCGNGHVHQPDGLMALLLGGPQFTWGIVHGSGFCTGERDDSCGWPMAGHHFIRDKDGKEIATIHNLPLAVHPEHVKKRESHV